MLKISQQYRWYALYCHTRHEKKVDADLQEDGFESWCPVMRTKRKWSDRMKWVDQPLFSSYIFVRVSHREYFKVLSHPAIMKYVSFGGKPSVVPDRHIEAIRKALGEAVNFEITSHNFKTGQLVTIDAGPMMGCTGQVVRHAGKKALYIRVGDTGYGLLVQVPAAHLMLDRVEKLEKVEF